MLDKKEKLTLFITSYIPLWIIFIIKIYMIEKNEKTLYLFKSLKIYKINHSVEVRILIILSFVVLILWMVLSLNKLLNNNRGNTSTIKVKRVKNISIDYLTNYFSLYLFPFFALNNFDTSNILILLLIVFLAGYIYVKNDIIYINPILHFLGYSIYIIEVVRSNDEAEMVFLITHRERYEIHGDLCNLYKFEKDFYFEKKVLNR